MTTRSIIECQRAPAPKLLWNRSLASNLAWTASELGHADTYLDCDVEEPNGHLFLRPERILEQSIDTRVPHVDADNCSLCGQCGSFCRFARWSAWARR